MILRYDFFLNMPSYNTKHFQLLNFSVRRHLRNLGMKNFRKVSICTHLQGMKNSVHALTTLKVAGLDFMPGMKFAKFQFHARHEIC